MSGQIKGNQERTVEVPTTICMCIRHVVLAGIFLLLLSVGLAQFLKLAVAKFPLDLSIESFVAEPATARVDFGIYFPGSENNYYPVNERLAAFLSHPPTVQADPRLLVRVRKTTCTTAEVVAEGREMLGLVKGAWMQTELEITPKEALEEILEVRLHYPRIDLARETLGASGPESEAEARVSVRVWQSRLAKAQAEVQREEKRRAAEAAAADKRRREEKATALWRGGLGIVIGLAILFVWWAADFGSDYEPGSYGGVPLLLAGIILTAGGLLLALGALMSP